jgi:hypothetical protein
MSPIGLDVGTSRVVLAESAGDGASDEYKYVSQLNAFVRIPYSRITENILRKEGVPYSTHGSDLVIHGNESERFADLLGREMRRPMRAGLVNSSEPESEAQLGEILASLLKNVGEKGRKVTFSVPAPPLGATDSTAYHETAVKRILTETGFDAQSLNEGLAVVYAELAESNYTGIGISCGGGLCNVCFAYLSVPVLTFSIPKAGDYIDANTAQATGELATRIRITKEQEFRLQANQPDKLHQVIASYYDEMIQALIEGMKDAFRVSKTMPKLGRPIPLVLSGGSATPGGFVERFQKTMAGTDFPIPVSEVRLASEPLSASAKGCLIAALSEA